MLMGNSNAPIPTELLPALQPADERILIVVLPGMFSDEASLKERGLHERIQKSWPDADVLLTAARLPYYTDGVLVQRLHRDILTPARENGYRQIWIAGGSMGGLGALMYEREHPGAVTGIVLLAPRLGDGALIEEIARAGGVQAWDAGPLPPEMNGGNYERQVWKMVQQRSGQPEFASRIWLICGDQDRMLPGSRLLAAQLPESHYVERPGDHNWRFWLSATEEMFGRVRLAQK